MDDSYSISKSSDSEKIDIECLSFHFLQSSNGQDGFQNGSIQICQKDFLEQVGVIQSIHIQDVFTTQEFETLLCEQAQKQDQGNEQRHQFELVLDFGHLESFFYGTVHVSWFVSETSKQTHFSRKN